MSFKLQDEGKIDRLTLNGVEKDLTDNVWSDLNHVKPGVFGAVAGANTLVVYDVAGNATTVTFTLDVTAPAVTVKEGGQYTVGANGSYSPGVVQAQRCRQGRSADGQRSGEGSDRQRLVRPSTS